jgi:hypothetical protein
MEKWSRFDSGASAEGNENPYDSHPLVRFLEGELAGKVESPIDRLDRYIDSVSAYYDTTSFALFLDLSEQLCTMSCGCGWKRDLLLMDKPDSTAEAGLLHACLVAMIDHCERQ